MKARDSKLLRSFQSLADEQATEAENWKLFRSFNAFRLLIALLALGLAFSGVSVPPFGSTAPGLFESSAVAYSAVAVLGIIGGLARRPAFDSQITVLIFADIVLLPLLMHASGGIDSGLGLLLLISVASASLMLGTRLTATFAALAFIALALEVNWTFLTGGEWVASRWDLDGYTRAGVLGAGLFATALLTHMLARRLRATEALARQRGVDLANLSQLNELVIARMQSGVLACDADGNVHMMNKMARTFLGLPPDNGSHRVLADLSPELATQFKQWLGRASGNIANIRAPIKTRAGYQLLPRFQPIGERRDDAGVLVFLEDTAVIRQQAAQFKMAALARLTASIAHEIRNPLGAISHAAQLMTESGSHATEDMRLLRIVEDQARRINVIIENVTQLSRRDKVHPMQIQLGFWIPDFIRQFTLDGQNPPEIFQTLAVTNVAICFDPDQLQQVVHNLCTNALRHSPEFAGQALIAFKTGLDADQRPYLDVIDWGKGVAPDVVEHIFDPFFTTTPKGTGLGLYITRELCEGNGGQIEYHPGEGGVGARFRVTFARPEECSELATSML